MPQMYDLNLNIVYFYIVTQGRSCVITSFLKVTPLNLDIPSTKIIVFKVNEIKKYHRA